MLYRACLEVSSNKDGLFHNVDVKLSDVCACSDRLMELHQVLLATMHEITNECEGVWRGTVE